MNDKNPSINIYKNSDSEERSLDSDRYKDKHLFGDNISISGRTGILFVTSLTWIGVSIRISGGVRLFVLIGSAVWLVAAAISAYFDHSGNINRNNKKKQNFGSSLVNNT